MKHAMAIIPGCLFGAVLGYFFLNFLVHTTSLFMQSDDDLNDAVRVGLILWPVFIIISGFISHRIQTLRKSHGRLSPASIIILALLGLSTGAVISDHLLSLSLVIYDWKNALSGNGERALILTVHGFLALAFAASVPLSVKRLISMNPQP